MKINIYLFVIIFCLLNVVLNTKNKRPNRRLSNLNNKKITKEIKTEVLTKVLKTKESIYDVLCNGKENKITCLEKDITSHLKSVTCVLNATLTEYYFLYHELIKLEKENDNTKKVSELKSKLVNESKCKLSQIENI